MKRYLLILPIFLITPNAFASNTSVNVSNNVTSKSNSEVTSNTNIKIETNGQTMEYKNSDAQKIEVKSVNGDSEIKINGEIVEVTKQSTPSPSIEKETDDLSETEEDNQSKGFIENIKDFIEKIFSIF